MEKIEMIFFKCWKWPLFTLLLCCQSLVMAISVKVDRNIIGMNETVVLTYEAKNLSAGADFGSISQNFNIISRSQRSSFAISNGRVQSSIVYTLVLQPIRIGTFTIAPIKIGNQQSASVTIKVQQQVVNKTPVSGDQYFSEIVVTPESPYVQQETNLALRIYSVDPLRMNRADVKVDRLNILAKDALVKQFDRGKHYTKRVNGQVFNVYEYRYKLYPQHSGSFEIPAIKIRLLTSYRRYRRFYGSRSGYRGVRYTSTKVRKIVVKAKPPSFKGREWLPAVKVSLSDVWSANPQQLYVNGSVTRTVTIEALGLSSAQLPEIKSIMPAGIKSYTEKAVTTNRRDGDNIRSTRKIKILFLPARAGTYTIPEIKLHWWNVKTGKAEVASLPTRTIQVLAKPGALPTLNSNTKNNSDVNKPVIAAKPTIEGPAKVVYRGYSVIWVWLAILLFIFWLVTMFVWWWSIKKVTADKVLTERGRPGPSVSAILNSEQSLQKMIKLSCESNKAEECNKALLNWSRLHWPKSFPTSVSQIAERLENPVFSREVDQLNQILYANEDSGKSSATIHYWDGGVLWEAFQEAVQERQGGKVGSPLASLYPSN